MKYADDCGAILKENMHVFGGGKLEPFHNYLMYRLHGAEYMVVVEIHWGPSPRGARMVSWSTWME